MTKSQRGGSLAAIVKEALVPLLLLGAQDKVKNKHSKKTKRKRLRRKRRTKKYRKRRRKSRRRKSRRRRRR
jgi:hypothetical protein